MSTCIRAKAQEERESFLGNDNFFYFDWWQVSHTNSLSVESLGYNSFNNNIISKEGWQSLKCHKSMGVLLHEKAETLEIIGQIESGLYSSLIGDILSL